VPLGGRGVRDYIAGANIAGFVRVADAMLALGLVGGRRMPPVWTSSPRLPDGHRGPLEYTYRPIAPGHWRGDPRRMQASRTLGLVRPGKRSAGRYVLPALLGAAGAILVVTGQLAGLGWALLVGTAWLLAVTAEAGLGGLGGIERGRRLTVGRSRRDRCPRGPSDRKWAADERGLAPAQPGTAWRRSSVDPDTSEAAARAPSRALPASKRGSGEGHWQNDP
jgi:hypothetical protein